MDKQEVRSQLPIHEKDISFLWPSHILCFPECTATFPSLYLLFHSFKTLVVMFIFIIATFTHAIFRRVRELSKGDYSALSIRLSVRMELGFH
jgi:hypothetical protein